MPDRALAEHTLATRALRLLDLTDLTETCSDRSIDALCVKAADLRGPVAAVCLWPQFVSRARDALRETGVRIATVVNFPEGADDIDRVLDDVGEALGDGAQEIDLVLPYRAFLAGDTAAAAEMIAAVRDVVDQGRTLKVILETGVLETPERIAAASQLAIAGGADFIKTSTGKTGVSATLPAARSMLDTIKAAGRPVGLKPSGGIRTLADAAAYLALADEIMGPAWASPKTFRFGASGLYDALIAAIEGRAEGSPKAGVY